MEDICRLLDHSRLNVISPYISDHSLMGNKLTSATEGRRCGVANIEENTAGSRCLRNQGRGMIRQQTGMHIYISPAQLRKAGRREENKLTQRHRSPFPVRFASVKKAETGYCVSGEASIVFPLLSCNVRLVLIWKHTHNDRDLTSVSISL